ncbi:hypothetical protein BIW11_10932 [Tropilaelaps mercedesae]|uniref:Uncharacterized protein n=1 Tax=Tropilaelaps mercedesae TaxID=418985 RepID=A0A1V9XDR1_9ACAR|nr:hypothetical protein BIW11_10932 [Tropilaelaps mercedesae]
MTPLHRAVILNNVASVKFLVNKFPETINARDRVGITNETDISECHRFKLFGGELVERWRHRIHHSEFRNRALMQSTCGPD